MRSSAVSAEVADSRLGLRMSGLVGIYVVWYRMVWYSTVPSISVLCSGLGPVLRNLHPQA